MSIVFGPKRDELIRNWRNLKYEELHNLYTSPNIIVMIKSRKIRWARHLAHMGRKGVHIKFLVGKAE
jgi:hypothetical protein